MAATVDLVLPIGALAAAVLKRLTARLHCLSPRSTHLVAAIPSAGSEASASHGRAVLLRRGAAGRFERYNCGSLSTKKTAGMTGTPDQRATPETVDFGFERVAPTAKAGRVRAVFDSVADRYDLMNDLMSFGTHRLWKRFLLSQTGLRPGRRALDVAGGTGDIATGLARQVGAEGRVVLSDINAAMLAHGRDRLLDRGFARTVDCVLANAESLPFRDASFDCVTIAFGLRNVTDKVAALASMFRVLRPGGQLLVLEFSKPVVPGLKPLYDGYSFRVLPALGRVVAGDADSYRYLAESIRMFPDQATLGEMMRSAGFDGCRHHNLSGGIVALHRGWRY